jgi:hypothetical protein
MATSFPPGELDFLGAAPEPVSGAAAAASPMAPLPDAVVAALMRLRGVDGVWLEQDAAGKPVVVLHYTPGGAAPHLPRRVHGLPTRIVGGEPIRAY